jgi:23S rRNA (cytidine1920-2'-O)/16S rRNA (cytidine1409-2'-O)-methyltransferase
MGSKHPKIRLDRLLVDQGLTPSRERARALILAGAVIVEDHREDKAGTLVAPDARVRLRGEDHPYVSRGGVKLKGALTAFGLHVAGLICLDVGASTGGFTDCLLQEGAAKVYALDVGYGQLAWRLREDRRVICIERTNIRYYDGRDIDSPIDLAAIDTSFISLRLVVPAVIPLIKANAAILALIKPQFEAGRERVQKNGVVKDPEVHRQVVQEMEAFFSGQGFEVRGICESPLQGPAGNREFFIYAGARKMRISP